MTKEIKNIEQLDGFLSNYEIQIPLISKTNTLTNSYSYKLYGELYENNISSVSLF